MAAGFSVVISATDKASGTLAKVNKSLALTMAPVNRLGKQIKTFGDVSGINRLGSGLEGLARRGVQVATSVAAISPALGAITGAASIAGLAALANKFAGMGQQLGFASQRLGIGAEKLSALQGAARLAGASAEDMTSGLRGLQQTLTDAAGGRNAGAVVLFEKLGVSFRDANGHARNVTDTLPELADKIAAIHDPQIQAMVATQLFGSAAEALLPLLRQGSAGIRANADEARRLTGITGDGIDASNRFQAAQARVQLAVEGLGSAVAGKLMPVLTPMLDGLANFIAAHSADVAAFFDRVARAIGAWVESGGIQRTIDGLTSFVEKVDSVVQAIGGWQTAAEVLLALMVGKFALGMVASIAKVTTALGAMRKALPAEGEVAGALNPGQAAGPRNVATGRSVGLGLGLLGVVSSLSEGRTSEEQRTFNEDSFIAKFGRAMGEQIGLTFDEHGNSEGLASKWFGAGSGGGIASSVGSFFNRGAFGGARRGGGPPAKVRPGPRATRFNGVEANPSPEDAAYKPLLDLLGRSEGTDRGRGYNETLGYGKWTGGADDLTHMTLDQLDAMQTKMLDRQHAAGIGSSASSAAGRYQFTQTTLRDMRAKYGLKGDQVFDEKMQDHLAALRIKMNGKLTQDSVAQIWASVPDAETGQSHYGQHTAVSSGEVQNALRKVAMGPPGGAPRPTGPAMTVAQPARGQAGANGAVDITMTHVNPPPGTTMDVKTSGNADMDKVKVMRSTDNLMLAGP